VASEPHDAGPVPPAPDSWSQHEWPRSQPWRWVIAGVAGILVVALLAWTVVGNGGREPRRADQASPAVTDPPAPATQADIEAVVADISDFVAREEGEPFKHAVSVELLGEGDFQARLLDDFDDDLDIIQQQQVLYTALGLIPPDLDLVESMKSLLGAGVVGFYDPETGALVVRGSGLTPYVRTTIAHELTHALDDQYHDLDRPEYDDAQDEVAFGFSAIVEGNARRVEGAYKASLSDDEQFQADAEELQLSQGFDFGSIPPVLIQMLAAPYQLGQALVDRIVDDRGNEGLAAALADPPHTSEQVIDPDAYESGETAIDVPHPQPQGTLVDEGVVGELLIQLLLAPAIGGDDARQAAEGWGGDWSVTWRDGDRSCAAVTIVGDDVIDTEELRQAFDHWAQGRDGVTIPPSGGGPFTVQSCV
jgi:hypothetical protein